MDGSKEQKALISVLNNIESLRTRKTFVTYKEYITEAIEKYRLLKVAEIMKEYKVDREAAEILTALEGDEDIRLAAHTEYQMFRAPNYKEN